MWMNRKTYVDILRENIRWHLRQNKKYREKEMKKYIKKRNKMPNPKKKLNAQKT